MQAYIAARVAAYAKQAQQQVQGLAGGQFCSSVPLAYWTGSWAGIIGDIYWQFGAGLLNHLMSWSWQGDVPAAECPLCFLVNPPCLLVAAPNPAMPMLILPQS
eukprot:scaffold197751_cov17-Tisochrysis_lutea.AAC.1